jgi:hypothetical protein
VGTGVGGWGVGGWWVVWEVGGWRFSSSMILDLRSWVSWDSWVKDSDFESRWASRVWIWAIWVLVRSVVNCSLVFMLSHSTLVLEIRNC